MIAFLKKEVSLKWSGRVNGEELALWAKENCGTTVKVNNALRERTAKSIPRFKRFLSVSVPLKDGSVFKRDNENSKRVSCGGPAQAATGREGSRGPARPRSGSRRTGGHPREAHRPTEGPGTAPRRQLYVTLFPEEKVTGEPGGREESNPQP
eukprot:Gb_41814 [translate_table: standard]